MIETHTELYLDNQWTDITSDVYYRAGVKISRGRANEASRTEPSKLTATFKNQGGKYSPHNPRSPLYGKIGRNTRLRQWVGTPPRGAASFVNTSVADGTTDVNHVAPSVVSEGATGLLLCSWISSFQPGEYTVPASMTEWTQGSGTYSVFTTATEALTADGATGTRTATYSGVSVDGHAHASIAVPGVDGGTPTVQEEVVEFSDTGAILEAWTSPNTQAGWWLVAVQAWDYDVNDEMMPAPLGSPLDWIPLADSVNAAATHPHIKAWAARVEVSGAQQVFFGGNTATEPNNYGRVYVLSDVKFSSARFSGEVSNWPPRWDPSGSDINVPIEAAGILRRLGQGKKPLYSPMRRQTMWGRYQRLPVAYWPCEDGKNSHQIASALEDGWPMTIYREPDRVDLASYSGFEASDPVPVMKTGSFIGPVGMYTPTDETQVRWLMHADEANNDISPEYEHELMTVDTSTGMRFVVSYRSLGSLRIKGLAPAAGTGALTEQFNSGAIAFGVNGNNALVNLKISQIGSKVSVSLSVNKFDLGISLGSAVYEMNGYTVGRVVRVYVSREDRLEDIGDVAVGHVSVHDEITGSFGVGPALLGHTGETAGRRLERLCFEEGIWLAYVGDLDATEPMGHQSTKTLVELFEECAAADGGILMETRGYIGLTYRTRRSLYNQET